MTISSGKESDFFTATPNFFTSSGRLGVASLTRFCTSTLLMSRFVPTSNATRSVIEPSFALIDRM